MWEKFNTFLHKFSQHYLWPLHFIFVYYSLLGFDFLDSYFFGFCFVDEKRPIPFIPIIWLPFGHYRCLHSSMDILHPMWSPHAKFPHFGSHVVYVAHQTLSCVVIFSFFTWSFLAVIMLFHIYVCIVHAIAHLCLNFVCHCLFFFTFYMFCTILQSQSMIYNKHN